MVFPTVTICNLNIFKSSQLKAVMTPEQFQMINSNVDGDQSGNQVGGNSNNGGNSNPAPIHPQQPTTKMQFGGNSNNGGNSNPAPIPPQQPTTKMQFGGNSNNGGNSNPAPMPPQQPITNMQLPVIYKID